MTVSNQIKSKDRVSSFGEVNTSEREVNSMLALVGKEAEKIDSKFLEPACGDGNFLLEILKRKLEFLVSMHGNSQNVFENGILSVVSSIYGHDILEDNILQANKRLFDYFLQVYRDVLGTTPSEEFQSQVKDSLATNITVANMLTKNLYPAKYFDVIIGNPPYQSVTGGSKAQAVPLYHKFVLLAKDLNPKFIVMITPSRWFSGGFGLNEFRQQMLNDTRIRKLVDFTDASFCFPGTRIKGGVSYFLWDRDNPGKCKITNCVNGIQHTMSRPLKEKNSKTFLRFNKSVPIFKKVVSSKFSSFMPKVSSQKPFGLATNYKIKSIKTDSSVLIYGRKIQGFINKEDIPQNHSLIDGHKLLISAGYGAGEGFPHQIINKPFIAEPNSCCTETYIVIGPFTSKEECTSVQSYMHTKFFRFMVMLVKNSQHALKKVYEFVPMQDFTQDWNDNKLYSLYKLTNSEINFIEEMIRPIKSEGLL